MFITLLITPKFNMENLQELWQKIMDNLKAKFSDETVELWLNPLKLFRKEANEFIIQLPNKFFKNWVIENCLEDIKTEVAKAYSLSNKDSIKMDFLELQEIPRISSQLAQQISALHERTLSSQPLYSFNPKFTFSKFIVGKTNQFAYSGAKAVAEEPGKQYNPLFIWGGVGLGKTHLLHAIGNHISEKFPLMRTLYVSTETFINDFIDSIRFNKPASFRNKYRAVDCLLIDDVQFLAEKQSCQEEFFYTFNAIFDSKKQIVLTSDRPPKDITGLEERLISRFVWGLVVPIDPPDLETRIAILRSKAEDERIYVPEDIILYLASVIKTNIRILEGALTKVVATVALLGTPLTLDSAQKILQDIIVQEKESKPISIEIIQKVVAEHYNIKPADMKSKRRTETLAIPRQIAMYIARELTNESHSAIGEAFGGKDHSTVIHSINKIKTKVSSDPFFSAEINKIIKKIRDEL